MAESDVAKRQRTGKNVSGQAAHASRIFSPFRVVGNVTNETPFAVGTLGTTFYIATSVGKSFQIYDASNLHLLFVSAQQTSSPITCLATHHHYLYAGFGKHVGIYKRGQLERLLTLPDCNATVRHMCVFGGYLCVSADDNSVYVFKTEGGSKYPTEFYTKFNIGSLLGGEILELVHLPTYLNKLVVVTHSNIVLYNIRTRKMLFSSDEFPDRITAAECAPALDVLALGTITGEVVLYNMKKGRKIRSIQTTNRVSSLSFRTDGSAHMAIASTNGDLVFYDLNRKTRIHVLKGIHRDTYGGISKVSFLNGQSIVVTSGGDNQLKEFAFDPSLSQSESETVVQPPRLLRSRGGHSQPPSRICFADSHSHFLMSASKDRSLWGFSLRKDAQSQEFSQRLHKNKDGSRIGGSTMKEKFPEIIALAIENFREGDWENVVTAHNGERAARTWNTKTKRVGRWTLSTSDDGLVKSVAMTQCGNFALIGSSNGGISVYNLQSGIKRKVYKMHKGSVTGLAVDGMNRKMVSCGLDGLVGFYDFTTNSFLGKLQLGAPITQLVYHRASELFAVALDDFSIQVIDSVTQRVVRQLWGHSNRITAFDFSPDGRWIVSASLDSTLRTWDLPTGTCIDGVRLESVATNVQFSANGDILATTHVAGNGIAIWSNRSQFKAISTRQIDEEAFARLLLPSASEDGGVSMLEGAFDAEDEEQSMGTYKSLEQINESLITLSLGPRNKMNTLLKLDVIRQRSKPKEAPKKPEKAPFFLQLTGEKVGDDASGREDALNANATTSLKEQEEKAASMQVQDQLAKFKPTTKLGFESEFTKLLRTSAAESDYNNFLVHLVNMSPASIDLEIRSLNAFEPFEEIVWFIEALVEGLKSGKNFDLYEAFMSLLFKAHGDIINANNKHEGIARSLQEWRAIHNSREHLDDLVKFCSSIINFVTTT